MPDTPIRKPDDNQPTQEPPVYGGQWGDTGKPKQQGQPPPDSPDKVTGPDEPRRQT